MKTKKILSLVLVGMMAASVGGVGVSLASAANKTADLTATENATITLTNVTKAKNVILLIGDGMGPEQIKAGEIYKGEALTMQGFPYKTTVQTRSALDEITDSAASATALATGKRTINGMVGKDPNYLNLETIVDIASGMGKRTGVISTEELYGATPMGFSSHAYNRNDTACLLQTAATTGNVNLFASYVMDEAYQNVFTAAGYEKIADVDGISDSTSDKVFGSYVIRADAPTMSANANRVAFNRVITEALEYLSQDEDGFFLMARTSITAGITTI